MILTIPAMRCFVRLALPTWARFNIGCTISSLHSGVDPSLRVWGTLAPHLSKLPLTNFYSMCVCVTICCPAYSSNTFVPIVPYCTHLTTHSHPFCYFPVFFTMKTMIQGKPLSAAVEKYRAEIWDSCKALWSVWVPAQLVNFAFVPRHMRIPFGTGTMMCVRI